MSKPKQKKNALYPGGKTPPGSRGGRDGLMRTPTTSHESLPNEKLVSMIPDRLWADYFMQLNGLGLYYDA